MECKHIWEEQREGNVFFCKRCGRTQYFPPEEETIYETDSTKKNSIQEDMKERIEKLEFTREICCDCSFNSLKIRNRININEKKIKEFQELYEYMRNMTHGRLNKLEEKLAKFGESWNYPYEKSACGFETENCSHYSDCFHILEQRDIIKNKETTITALHNRYSGDADNYNRAMMEIVNYQYQEKQLVDKNDRILKYMKKNFPSNWEYSKLTDKVIELLEEKVL